MFYFKKVNSLLFLSLTLVSIISFAHAMDNQIIEKKEELKTIIKKLPKNEHLQKRQIVKQWVEKCHTERQRVEEANREARVRQEAENKRLDALYKENDIKKQRIRDKGCTPEEEQRAKQFIQDNDLDSSTTNITEIAIQLLEREEDYSELPVATLVFFKPSRPANSWSDPYLLTAFQLVDLGFTDFDSIGE